MHRSTTPSRPSTAAVIGLKLIVSAIVWNFCLPLLLATILSLIIVPFVLLPAIKNGFRWEGVLFPLWVSAGTIAWYCLIVMNVSWVRGRRMRGRLPWIGMLIATPCVAPFVVNVFARATTSFDDWIIFVPEVTFASYLVWWHACVPSAGRDANGNHH